MSRIKEIDYDKIINNCTKAIRENQTLCKLLHYTENNPLEMPEIEDTSILSMDTEEHKKCIFKSPFVPSAEDKRIILDIFMTEAEPSTGYCYEDVYISIFIMSHVDLWEINTGNRLYKIISELNKLFSYTTNMDVVGRSLMEHKKFLSWNEKYQGYALVYKATDFA